MTTLSELLPPLYNRTADGRISWRLGGDNVILAQEANLVIQIIEATVGAYTIYLRNADGIKIDELIAFEGTESYEVLKSIFERVKRDALKVDEALERLKARLRD